METKTLGHTDLEISTIGLGAWALGGGDWAFGWGDQDDTVSIETIHRAVDEGVNWIDTAAVYGLGRSEEVVGQALRELQPSRRPLVFTKCGLTWGPSGKIAHRLTPESIRREIEGSLLRLGVDTLDLYQIHWPSYPPGSPSPDLEGAWATLSALQAEGKVRHIGVSNFDVDQMERVRPIAPLASLQPPYSLLERGIEAEILPYCRRHVIGVLAYSPMKSGLLSGKMTRERIEALPENDWRKSKSLDFLDPRLGRILDFVDHVRAVGEPEGYSPAQVAIAWTLKQPAVSAAIVGARRADQVPEIVAASSCRLSPDAWRAIEAAIPA